MYESYFRGKFEDIFHKMYPDFEIPYNSYFDTKDNSYHERKTANSFSVYFQLSSELSTALMKVYGLLPDVQWYARYRYGKLKSVPTVIEKIDDEEFLSHAEECTSKGHLLRLTMEGIQYGEWTEPEWFNETGHDCDLLHTLLVMDYDKDDIKNVIRYMNEDHSDLFPKDLMSKGKFKYNRLWIPLKGGKYFVLSKNPYDTLWASTGNNYCSCYNLDSPTGYITGSPYLITKDWYFMAYVSNGTSKKYPLFEGKKFRLPQIDGRCWAYATDDGLRRDKIYGEAPELMIMLETGKSTIHGGMNLCDDFCRYATYADSVDTCGRYTYGNGSLGCGNWRNSSVKCVAASIIYNPDLRVEDVDSIELRQGKYGIYKRCPVTGLLINQNEEKHWAAKYMDKPVQHLIIFTYSVDDETLLGVTNKHCTLERAKEVAREYANDYYSNTDATLLKIIDGNKMTFQPFYRKGE